MTSLSICVPFSPLASTEEQKKRRFNHADEDKDGQLSQDEIISMFHPEERSHMYDVVIDVRFSSLFFAFKLLINSVILLVFIFLGTLSFSKKIAAMMGPVHASSFTSDEPNGAN